MFISVVHRMGLYLDDNKPVQLGTLNPTHSLTHSVITNHLQNDILLEMKCYI